MTVKDLIEKLTTYDPAMKVVIGSGDEVWSFNDLAPAKMIETFGEPWMFWNEECADEEEVDVYETVLWLSMDAG